MAPKLGTIPIPNPRGLAIAAPGYGGPSPTTAGSKTMISTTTEIADQTENTYRPNIQH